MELHVIARDPEEIKLLAQFIGASGIAMPPAPESDKPDAEAPRRARRKKDDPASAALDAPKAPTGFALFKSDGTASETAYTTSKEAADALVDVLKNAPSRESLDNMLQVNAPVIGALETSDSDRVTRAYGEKTSEFAASAAEAVKQTVDAPAEDDIFFQEMGSDAPKPQPPTDPEQLKTEVRALIRDYALGVGVDNGRKYIAGFDKADSFSKIDLKHYPAIWSDLTVQVNTPDMKAKIEEARAKAAKKA